MVKQYYANEPHILGWLRNFILPTDVILDVGSGDGRHRDLGGTRYVSLDCWPPAEPDYLLDLNGSDLPDVGASVILMIDLLEHLAHSRGLDILAQAQAMASRAVVVFTPLVWEANRMAYKNGFYKGNEAVLHRSLWDLRDFGSDWVRVWLPSTLDSFFGYWIRK